MSPTATPDPISNYFSFPRGRLRCLFTFLLLLSFAGIKANNKADSLAKLLESTKVDTVKIELMNQLVWELKETQPEKAVIYGKQAIALAQKLNRKRSVAQTMNNLGTVFYISGNYPEALNYYLHALEIREELKDTNAIGKSYNNIALVYYEQGELKSALVYHHKSLGIKLSRNDPKGIASSYGNIGNVYFQYAKKSAGKSKDSLLQLCLNYHIKALDIQSQMVDRDPGNIGVLANKSGTYNNIGNVYSEKALVTKNPGEFRLALNYHRKALDIAHKIEDTRGISHSYINLAGIYEKLRDDELAIEYYNKALDMTIPVNMKEEQKSCYEGLSELYEKNRDFEKSLFYFKKFNSIKDSILNISKAEQIAQMQTRFDTDKKNREIELLQKDKALSESEMVQQKTVRNSFIVGFVLVFALILILLNRYRLKTRSAEALSRQNHIIEEKQKEILDSIHYAKRIQQSLLPSDKYIERTLMNLKK